jgi:hypothetical protein
MFSNRSAVGGSPESAGANIWSSRRWRPLVKDLGPPKYQGARIAVRLQVRNALLLTDTRAALPGSRGMSMNPANSPPPTREARARRPHASMTSRYGRRRRSLEQVEDQRFDGIIHGPACARSVRLRL